MFFYDSATLFVSVMSEYGLSAVDYMNHKSTNTAINEAEQQQAKNFTSNADMRLQLGMKRLEQLTESLSSQDP